MTDEKRPAPAVEARPTCKHGKYATQFCSQCGICPKIVAQPPTPAKNKLLRPIVSQEDVDELTAPAVTPPPPPPPDWNERYKTMPEVQCKCGQHTIPAAFDAVSWYWQRHGREECLLELPNALCWCGLLRSEHTKGHKEVVAAAAPAVEARPQKDIPSIIALTKEVFRNPLSIRVSRMAHGSELSEHHLALLVASYALAQIDNMQEREMDRINCEVTPPFVITLPKSEPVEARPATPQHILKTCNCHKQACPICDWGAAICSICGAAEIELEKRCVTAREAEAPPQEKD